MTSSNWLSKAIEEIHHTPAEMIDKRLHQIRAELAGADPDTCRVCGTTCVNAADIDGELRVVCFERQCPKCNRQSLGVSILEAKIECGPNVSEIKTPLGWYCYHCDGPLQPPAEPKRDIEAQERRFTHTQLIGDRKEDHHVNYDPESIIPVCTTCHSKIHSGVDGYEVYQPEQTRKEWEADNE